MFTRPTYLSIKLVLSPVEDVTLCLVYHMFIVYVYCLLSAVSVWPGCLAESCSFTSALVVCRLATVCPPVWPGGVWPVWSCRVWVRRERDPGPGTSGRHTGGSFRGDQGEETLRLCQGSWHDWDGGQDIIRYSDQWERDGPGLNYI